jgi:micrococcal nuclease
VSGETIRAESLFIYRATLNRVIDGDTIVLDVDLGFDQHYKNLPVRLLGVDTPEINRAATKEAGLAAKSAVIGYVAEGTLIIRTFLAPPGKDSLRRYLADIQVTRPDGTQFNVSERLLAEGHAVPYEG